MKFYSIQLKTIGLLAIEGRISYRRLKREFNLDDAFLEDLRHELIQVRQLAVDHGGEYMLWAGADHTTGLSVNADDVAALEPVILSRQIESDESKEKNSESSSQVQLPVGQSPISNSERRPLTVMFCDLADSTAISTKLDPEDLQDIVHAYQETCTKCIQKYEGFIAKYMGDGILVYFGYPLSLERNAERAVLSALAIVEAMNDLNQTVGQANSVEIAVRIGIATGTVMVGEVIGEGIAQERTVVGEAPNRAARLQGIAARNGIVISSVTRELTGEVFNYEDLGTHELKGIPGLTSAWGVTGQRGHEETREKPIEMLMVSDGIPMLQGRREELDMLNRAWQSTKDDGRGRTVMFSGEAGIGKSTLIESLKNDVLAQNLPLLTMRCSPYHTNSALYPVINHFKQLARWQTADDALVRLAKLEEMLKRYTRPLNESVPLLASLLSLEISEDTYPALKLAPIQLKQQTQDLIVGISIEVAERRPFLQLWEDLHWADPSTLELIGLLIEQAPAASLLIVTTARPEFVSPWSKNSQITTIALNRLDRPAAEKIIARVALNKPLPAAVVDHIVSKTDGVPLYIEELTKAIFSSNILEDVGDRYELIGPLSSLSIPNSLQESLMARLDKFPAVRELAQLGSVLGREFAYGMISNLTAVDEALLQQGLRQLVVAELLYQRGRPPESKYIFKHALVQDAAYASLLRRARQQFHQDVARMLETRYPELVLGQPELIAHHFNEGGLFDRAIDYLYKAGERSLLSSANEEAIAHLTKGLGIIRSMPQSPKLEQRELSMLLISAPALVATRGYAAAQVEPMYNRALVLCRKLGEKTKEFLVLLGQSMTCILSADILRARDLANQAVELAKTSDELGFDLSAQRQLGLASFCQGEFEFSADCFDKVVQAYDIDIHGEFAFLRGGADFGVAALATSSFVLIALGYPDQARSRCAEAVALSQKLEHPLSMAYAHWASGYIHRECGEWECAVGHAEKVLSIALDKSFPQYIAWATIQLGTLKIDQGAIEEAVTEIQKGIALNLAIGSRLWSPYWATNLADAYRLNRLEAEGLAVIADAYDYVAQSEDRQVESELYRMNGRLLYKGGTADFSEAASYFHRAIDVAQSQNAKLWELRATTELARVWHDQGKQDQARTLLKPVYEWFTEGFDTADMINAKAVLDILE